MPEPQVLNDAGVSEREAEVLDLLGEHLTNAEIAARLFIGVRTVESHVSSLLRKLAVGDRRALANLAATLRVVGESEPGADIALPSPPSLPSPLTSFVGRVAERAALVEALRDHRLVTALGPGGVGKTRLALAVAADLSDRYGGGVWYVDLVPVTDPTMVGAAVAGALGFGEQLGRSPTDTVIARLAGADVVVVLDNCEHLVDGVVEFVERLLSACPKVVVLATSQTRLLLPFEWVFPVPGLSLPGGDGDDDGDRGAEGDAVRLFVERATMAGWSPTEAVEDRGRIAAICDGLDGVALAIELAAARLATFGLDGLEAGLANPLGMLAGGSRMDERHQSVRSALDWSYGLLDPVDQAVLRRVSVFAAPFTSDAAVRVAADAPVESGNDVPTALARLADHSLLVVISGTAGTRYRMLETIRQYGAERLDELAEHGEVHGRHLQWCQATAAALSVDGDAGGASVDAATLDVAAFDAVADDLRAAIGWAAGDPDRRAAAHDLALRLAELCFARGLLSEAQRRYEQAGGLAADDAESARALHLGAAAALTRLAGDEALRLQHAAAEAARRAGDNRGAAIEIAWAAELIDRNWGLLSEPPPPGEVGSLLREARELAGGDPHVEAAILVVEAGGGGQDVDPADSEDRFRRAEHAVRLAQHVGDSRLESAALDQLTVAQLARGDVHDGAASARRRLDLLAPLRLDVDVVFELSDALHMAAMTSIGAGDMEAARRYAQRRYDLPVHREEFHLVVNWLLVPAALAGDLDDVVELGEQFRVGWERAGHPTRPGLSITPAAAAMASGLRGDDDARREWLAIHDAMRRNADPARHSAPYSPTFDAIVALHRGEIDDAVALLPDDLLSLEFWYVGVWRQWFAAVWAESAVLANHPDRAEHITRARRITLHNPIATAMVDRADALVTGDVAALLESAAALDAASCPYQRARTLVFAGGDARVEGEATLAAMGAAPMAICS